MRKIFSCLMLMIIGATTLFATSPDRVLVREKESGNIKGFLAERVDSIFFDKIEGDVSAAVEFKDYTIEERLVDGEFSDQSVITVDVTRSENCVGFRVCVFPPNAAVYLENDYMAISYAEYYGSPIYYQDFVEGELYGYGILTADADFNVVTVGYDKYGIACDVQKAAFHTPKPEVVGNPSVDCEVLKVDQTNIIFKFTPNEDCSEYNFCIYKKGEFMQQYEMFAPFFGFNSPDEMIYMWGGGAKKSEYVHTYTAMDPGTDYELYIAVKDVNGNFGERVVVPVTTKSYGGEGVAEVEITVGKFEYNETEDLYLQTMTFTPNDDTAFYRELIISKEVYNTPDWGEEGVMTYLTTDDPTNPYQNMYQEDTWPWTVEPATDYYAFALAQNAKKEWGPLVKIEFSTPAVNARKAAQAPVAKRMEPKSGSQVGAMTMQQAASMAKLKSTKKQVQIVEK